MVRVPSQSPDDPADSDTALDDSAAGDDNANDVPRDDQLHYHAAVLDLQASPFEFRVLEVTDRKRRWPSTEALFPALSARP